MGERLSAFETLLRNLAKLPGLGFLLTYVDKAHTTKAVFDNQKSDYQGYLQTAKGVGGDAKNVVRGKNSKSAAEDPETADAGDDPERP